MRPGRLVALAPCLGVPPGVAAASSLLLIGTTGAAALLSIGTGSALLLKPRPVLFWMAGPLVTGAVIAYPPLKHKI